MLAGIFAAQNLAGARHDVWSVNTERDYHEERRSPQQRLAPTRVADEAPLAPDRVIQVAFARLDPVALGVALGTVCGLGLFLATAFLLLEGGPNVGRNLALLGQYLFGFRVSWAGALLGLVEAAASGFAVGYVVARLRNRVLGSYAVWLQRRAAAKARRHLLDRV